MKIKNTIFIGCCYFALIATASFTPDEARRIFDEVSMPSTSFYLEKGDYLFMELKWKVEENGDSEAKEAQELAVELNALEQYISSELSKQNVKSPFCPELTSWLLPEQEFDFSNVTCSTLVDEESNGERRCVIAFDLATLSKVKADAARKINAVIERKNSDWTEALKNAYVNFKTKKEKQLFFLMLNCPIVCFLDDSIGIDQKELSNRTDSASKELWQLLDWRPTTGSIFSEYPVLTWSFYLKDNSTFFFPQWKEDDQGAFEEAKELYLKGKDIPRIFSLLIKSISINPIGSTKWEYLGGVLKATARYQDAIIAYMQAIRINNSNIWAWKGLADSLEKSGMTENAAGLIWFIRMKECS